MEKEVNGKNGGLPKALDVSEKNPLLKKRKVTIIASSHKGEDDPNATSWISIYMASALSFVGAAQYTLYFTSLWPYIRKIDPTISESFFGYIIAVYSVGQIISSPLFGYWSNRIKRVRFPIVIGFLFMLVGNMVYLTLEFADVPYRGAFLIVSRLLLGIGSGNVVLLRSYAATSPAVKDRSRAIALVTCGQALGLTGGPAFQLLFTPIGYPGWSLIRNHLRMNVYTAPAYLSCLMNVLSIVVMQTIFYENYAGLMETVSTSNIDTPKPKSRLPPYDLIAVSVCLVTRFTYMFINTNLETIGSPYSMMMFSWMEEQTVLYTSIAQGLIGLLTLGTYIVYILLKFESWLNLRIASICALFVLMAFHLITYSWPFLSGHVDIMHNHTSAGCNIDKFEWCETLRPVNVWLYFTSYILALGLAFPILNIGNTTLYSDVLGPRRQGTLQGVLQVAGGAARLVGPVVISMFYTAYGPVMAWNMEVVVIGATVVLWIVFYGRIVSLVPADVDKLHSISVIDVVPDLSAPSSILSSHGDSQVNNTLGVGVGSTVGSAGKIPLKEASTPLIDYQ